MYHINPKTGDAKRCRAKEGNCPFGSDAPHFDTQRDAQVHWENVNHYDVFVTATKKTIVLSDIDGTLVKSSLVLENAVELHESGAVDLGDSPAKWKADMKNESLVVELALKYRDALIGKNVSFTRAKETVDRLLADNENFYKTFEQLKEHQRNGDEVVLISGSPDYLVRILAKKFGFKYHASVYYKNSRGKFTGGIDLMAGGEAKQKVIDSLNLHEYDHVIGIGDTASDGPLLRAAKHSILVDPTEETLEKLRAQKIRIDKIVHE